MPEIQCLFCYTLLCVSLLGVVLNVTFSDKEFNFMQCSNITKVILFGFAQNRMHDPANEFKIRRLKKKRYAMSNKVPLNECCLIHLKFAVVQGTANYKKKHISKLQENQEGLELTEIMHSLVCNHETVLGKTVETLNRIGTQTSSAVKVCDFQGIEK